MLLVFSPNGGYVAPTGLTLVTAATSPAYAGRCIVFTADETTSGNITWPGDRDLIPMPGSGAKINHSTYTFSYAGSTKAWPLAQVLNGTGAVTFAKGGIIYPQWLGVKGDAVTDDTAAVIKAITATIASAPATLQFPTTTYKCNSVLGAFTGSNFTIDFGGSTLDFSDIPLATHDRILMITGTKESDVLLTSNSSVGDTVVNVSTVGFAAGQMIRICSDGVWDSARTSTRIGEIGFVESVSSGSSLVLTTPLQSTYATASSAKIARINPVEYVRIKNGNIVGPAGNDELRGLAFLNAKDCHFENISSSYVDYFHMQLTDCIDCSVANCHFETSIHSSTGYGLSFADCSCDCIAVNNHFTGVRHSLSTNNNVSTSYGIVRRILFQGNTVRDSAPATGGSGGDAIDTHAGAEDIFIIDNVVHSSSGIGINVEARSAVISGNRIKHTTSVGIYAHNYSDQTGQIQINNNFVDTIGDGSGTDPGIWVYSRAEGGYRRAVISGNMINETTSAGIRVQGVATSILYDCSINGNTVYTDDATQAIYMEYVQRAAVSGNVLESASNPIYMENCSACNITGNQLNMIGTADTGHGIRIVVNGGSCTRNLISSNVIQKVGSGITTSYGVHLDDSVTQTGVFNNNITIMTTQIVLGAGSGNVEANNL